MAPRSGPRGPNRQAGPRSPGPRSPRTVTDEDLLYFYQVAFRAKGCKILCTWFTSSYWIQFYWNDKLLNQVTELCQTSSPSMSTPIPALSATRVPVAGAEKKFQTVEIIKASTNLWQLAPGPPIALLSVSLVVVSSSSVGAPFTVPVAWDGQFCVERF